VGVCAALVGSDRDVFAAGLCREVGAGVATKRMDHLFSDAVRAGFAVAVAAAGVEHLAQRCSADAELPGHMGAHRVPAQGTLLQQGKPRLLHVTGLHAASFLALASSGGCGPMSSLST